MNSRRLIALTQGSIKPNLALNLADYTKKREQWNGAQWSFCAAGNPQPHHVGLGSSQESAWHRKFRPIGILGSQRDARPSGATHFLMKRLPKVATEMAMQVNSAFTAMQHRNRFTPGQYIAASPQVLTSAVQIAISKTGPPSGLLSQSVGCVE
jgi:hypothetical protein